MRLINNTTKNTPLFLTLALLVLGVALMAALELTNKTHFFHDEPIPSGKTASEYTKGEPVNNSQTAKDSATKSASAGSSSKSSDETIEEAALESPRGNFVSSHHIAQDQNETSTCNTTPGAYCTISFTQDGITKALPARVVDGGGAAYWSWSPKSVGLTTGNWSIQATANSGKQKLTSNDALSLQVN